MTISYNWLLDYLPVSDKDISAYIQPEALSGILTAIGLEVESLHKAETIKGGLRGLLVGEVLTCDKHPDADKLKLTTVNIGTEILQIVCGAANVAAAQKVIVAPAGTTIYPFSGGEIYLKKTKIRGVESNGMICAEDEIGISEDHGGIIVLPESAIPGTPASSIYASDEDHIFEIGLTPNRTDAMSHYGVARDVCAYLSHRLNKKIHPVLPKPDITNEIGTCAIDVVIENTASCMRYTGALIQSVEVKESAEWMKRKLQAIGVKPINNIVDITNFILHESGQPLHAFDADHISGNKVIIKNATDKQSFITLDEKERILSSSDLMICNAKEPMCIAGVYGGLKSGVTKTTKNIFLESAAFSAESVRKTSLSLNLRTDAATRFEKGTDSSKTLEVLVRALSLIKEMSGGTVSGIIDIFPTPAEPVIIALPFLFVKKLSGKNYNNVDIIQILTALDFEILQNENENLLVKVPSHKNDIHHPADLVEEIMRIDGLDNIDIPASIHITPSIEKLAAKTNIREKISNYLSSSCHEIFTNSITNSHLYNENILQSSVKMINSLSAELDMLRPEMLNSGLAALSHNINRKNTELRFYEFGKTYSHTHGKYTETEHLSVYLTGQVSNADWNHRPEKSSLFYLKGMLQSVFEMIGAQDVVFEPSEKAGLVNALEIFYRRKKIGICGQVAEAVLQKFDIRQPVFFGDIEWIQLLGEKKNEKYKEISKFPFAERDLALVVDKKLNYADIEKATKKLKIGNLTAVRLFDVFESEKLGKDKKSMAVNFSFSDDSKTLTDADIDAMMQQLVHVYEKELNAEIRK